ncbi:hypothetical protein H9P43_006622 [Blastocladiella emersonii ATCC 22665]|nr:hypothetical protein H9P43_006622 [Blastocladiella emersonii ATCC 22665]
MDWREVAPTTLWTYAVAVALAVPTTLYLLRRYRRLHPRCYCCRRPRSRRNSTHHESRGRRPGLLVAYGLLTCADILNGFAYIWSAWRSSPPPNFVLARTVYLFTAGPLLPLLALIITRRHALIVIEDPGNQQRLVRAMIALSGAFTAVFIARGLASVVELAAIGDPARWLSTRLVPNWISSCEFALMAVTLGGALWTLRVGLREPAAVGAASKPATAVAETPCAAPVPQGSATLVFAPLSPTECPTTPPAPPPRRDSRAIGIRVALTRTFRILTAALVIEWIAVFALKAATLPVRDNARTSLMASVALVTEASFEWILHRAQRRERERGRARAGHGIDSANSLYFTWFTWRELGTAFLVSRSLFTAIYVFLLPLAAVIITRRHAMIIVEDRRKRARMVRVIHLLACGIGTFSFGVGTANLYRQAQVDQPAVWVNSLIFPLWALVPLSILPTAVLGGAFWALRIAFREPNLVRVTASASLPAIGSADGKPAPGSGPSRVNLDVLASAHDASSSAAASPTSPTAGASSTSAVLLPLHSVANSPPAAAAPKRGGLEIVLTRSFQTLTVTMIVLWIAMVALIISPLPVRTNAITTCIGSLMLVTETSFEWLLRQNREREEAKLNTCYFTWFTWRELGTAFFASRFLFVAINVILLPLAAVVVTRRYALIIVEDRAKRARMVRAIHVLAILDALFMLSVGATSLYRQAQINEPAVWVNGAIFPVWTLAPLAIFPTFILSSAFWALRVAFRNPEQLSTRSRASSSKASTSDETKSATAGGPLQEILTTVRKASFSATHAPPAPPAPPAPLGHQALRGSSQHSLTPTFTTATAPRRSDLEVGLIRSFKTLTIIMSLICVSLTVLILSPIPVRVSATTALVGSLLLVTEASFELILERNRKREQAKRKLGTAYFASRAFFAVIYGFLVPIASVIIIRRHAVIIVEDRAKQARMIRAIDILAVLDALFVLIVGGINLYQQKKIDQPAVLVKSAIIPVWTLIPLTILPAVVLGSTFWALRVEFRDPDQLWKLNSTASSTAGSGDAKGAPPLGPLGGHLEILATAREASSPVAASPSAVSPMMPSPTALLLRASSMHSVATTSTALTHKRSDLEVVLTRSFKTLTIILIFLCIATSAVVMIPSPVRASASTTFMGSLLLVTESSFEVLLKLNREREQAKRKKKHAKESFYAEGMSVVPSFM